MKNKSCTFFSKSIKFVWKNEERYFPLWNFKKVQDKGFTLIEILIVMVIILIISSASYVAFIRFNKQQRINTSYEDLRNTFNEAKASALSQTINKCRQSYTLVGHRIDFTSTSYTLLEVCDLSGTKTSYTTKSKTLPSEITLTANPPSFLFLVLTGEFSNSVNPGLAGTVQLTNGTDIKTITVQPIGRIE